MSSRRRLPQVLRWTGVTLFLVSMLALHAGAGFLSKYDDPARLGVAVHVTLTNGFAIRWVEKPEAGNHQLNLVFVHGSPGGGGIWAAQFQSALTNENLIAYDRPGFGGSLPVWQQPHLQEQADALMTLPVFAATNRVLLVGHSYGSPVALLAALEHPDKIGGVLLIGGDVDPALEKTWIVQYCFGWRVTSWLLPRAWRQCNREMLTVRADLAGMQKLLPHLSVPVLMLHGDRDPLVPVENVAWLEQQLAVLGKSGLFAKIILPGVNHFIPWEHPADVERAVRALVEMASPP